MTKAISVHLDPFYQTDGPIPQLLQMLGTNGFSSSFRGLSWPVGSHLLEARDAWDILLLPFEVGPQPVPDARHLSPAFWPKWCNLFSKLPWD